jgi:hypothetical protein
MTMKVGSLVGRGLESNPHLGLVMKKYHGITYSEVVVFWFNVKTSYGKNVIEWCAPRTLRLICQ